MARCGWTFVIAVSCAAAVAPPCRAGKLAAVRDAVRSSSDDHRDDDESDKADQSDDDEHRHARRRTRRRKRHRHRPRRPLFDLIPVVSLGAEVHEEPADDSWPPAPIAPAYREPADEEFVEVPDVGYFSVPYDVDRWAVRIGLERGFKTDNVGRLGFHLLAESALRLGVLVDWNSYIEDLGHGDHDRLSLGDVDALLIVTESEYARVRVGAGLSWLDDEYSDASFGANVLLSADLFPCKPWIVTGRVAWGQIGDAETFHARATAGASWKFLEIFGGYDYREIGSVPLHGPLLGLRFWF